MGVELRDEVGESDVEEGDGGRRGFLGGKWGEGGRGGREREIKKWKVRFEVRNRGFLEREGGWVEEYF